MGILTSLRDYLMTCSSMELVDRSEVLAKLEGSAAADPGTFVSMGNGKVVEDLAGNRICESNYAFFAREHREGGGNDQEESNFEEKIKDWLSEQNRAENLPLLPGKYEAEALAVENVMLADTDEGGKEIYRVLVKMKFNRRKREAERREIR